ncbi:MAG TPA: 6-carboxytetrahydropterin synthase [Gemmatimonadales bacterium]|nr:6-carboxytetrahydropterin synthase [Gemmatimonadales bacterium]
MSLTVVRRVTFEAEHHGRKLGYALEVSVTGPLDAATGSIVDFHFVRDVAKGAVERIIGSGAVSPPTAENLVIAFWNELGPALLPARLTHLRLWETPNQSVEYDGP